MHVVHVISPSSALAFGTKVSKKHESTSPSAMQVKKQQKKICTEEKLDVISGLRKR
jgi:hypothetical protein